MPWPIRTLGEVCDLVNGGTPKTGVATYWDGPHQWVTPAEMGRRETPFIANTERTITDAGVADSSARLVPPFSVILSSRAPIGHLVINEVPMAFNQGCKGLVPGPTIHFKFLYYWLFSQVDTLNALGTGATFKEVSLGKLRNVPIPVPPVIEQQRIATLLDEAFEGIATASLNADRNIANARELSSMLLDTLLRREDGARQVALEDAVSADCSLSYGIVQPGDETSGGLPIVRPVDIGQRLVGLDGLKRIAPERAAGYRRTTLQGSDLLLCVRGTTGVVSQATPELAGANVTRGLVPIRFRPDVLHQDLGYFLLMSKSVQRQIRKATYGAALMQINIRDLRRVMLTIPPLDRQETLLAALEEAASGAGRLGESYRARLAALAELRASLLHRAFTGQLTRTPAIAA